MNILIKNVDIITSQKDNMLIKNGFIAISNGRIEIVSDKVEDFSDFKEQKIIDGSKNIAMPGLVNAHTHTPMTILRNYADDLALEDWLFNHIFPVEAKLTKDDVYWGSLLAMAEMIKSGTTCFADMYYFVEETARAVSESYIKANISMSAFPFQFKDGAPVFSDDTVNYRRFFKEWNNASDGRIKNYVLVHSPYIYDMESMKNSALFAKEMNTGIHIHILETQKELFDTTNKYGKDGCMACLDAGIFDVPVISAHCVHMSDENIDVFREKGVSAIHNPTSNLKLGSGIARIPEMIGKGVNVALGTDGTASNNNLNMFEEISLAALIHKGIRQDPTLITATDAICMATTNGAKALGFGDESGIIKKGMKADIILINTDKIHFTPYHNPVSAICYSAQASDVETVIIDGKIVMEKGEIKTIDVEKARYMVSEIAKRVT